MNTILIEYLIILSIGAVVGGAATYKIEHANVVAMKLELANAQIEADSVLAIANKKELEHREQQQNLNKELDNAHESFIVTTNAYSVKLNNAINGLRYNTKNQGCRSTLPKSNSAGLNKEDGADTFDVSREFLEKLARESKRADEITIDKNELLVFVKDKNCGVK